MAPRTAPGPGTRPRTAPGTRTAPGNRTGPSTVAEPTVAEPTLAEPPSRPLRRDAELNLERILAAAQDVFAESGFDASMEQIANRAGVGVGTLYRRFPNKESLVLAIMEMANRHSEALVHDVLAHAAPAEGIFEFMRRCVGLAPSLRGAGLPVTPAGRDASDHGGQTVSLDHPSPGQRQGGWLHPVRRHL